MRCCAAVIGGVYDLLVVRLLLFPCCRDRCLLPIAAHHPFHTIACSLACSLARYHNMCLLFTDLSTRHICSCRQQSRDWCNLDLGMESHSRFFFSVHLAGILFLLHHSTYSLSSFALSHPEYYYQPQHLTLHWFTYRRLKKTFYTK